MVSNKSLCAAGCVRSRSCRHNSPPVGSSMPVANSNNSSPNENMSAAEEGTEECDRYSGAMYCTSPSMPSRDDEDDDELVDDEVRGGEGNRTDEAEEAEDEDDESGSRVSESLSSNKAQAVVVNVVLVGRGASSIFFLLRFKPPSLAWPSLA